MPSGDDDDDFDESGGYFDQSGNFVWPDGSYITPSGIYVSAGSTGNLTAMPTGGSTYPGSGPGGAGAGTGVSGFGGGGGAAPGGGSVFSNPGFYAAGLGAIGGAVAAAGTADAQREQNRLAALAAARQSAQSFYNYLSTRGINFQQLVSKYPDLLDEYQRARAAGDQRDFNTWAAEALTNAPTHPIWNDIAAPTIGRGAQNTTLPAWAVDANGNPIQPSLFADIAGVYAGTRGTGAAPSTSTSGLSNPLPRVNLQTAATAPIASIATPQNVAALFAAQPQLREQIVANMAGSDDARTPEQWLVDHITQTEAQAGGGTFTQALRTFLTPANGDPPPGGFVGPVVGPGTAGSDGKPGSLPGGVPGTGSNTTLDPRIAALLPNSAAVVGGIFDGTYLNQTLAGLAPVQAARLQEAGAQAKRIAELRDLSGNLLGTELAGIAGVTAAQNTGAEGVFGASTAAAQGVYNTTIDRLANLLGIRREAAQQIYDANLGSAGGVRDARRTGAQDIYGAELLRADTYGQASRQALDRLLAQQGAERARRGFTGGSSGSDITSARLMADYLQRGAGARAEAGVGLQNRLSEAGIGYATDTGRAGVGRATTIGASNEADSTARLTAGVDLARSMGAAGVNRATTSASIGEQGAVAQLRANAADATRRLGYLTADADIARARADLQNATDALAALTTNQNRVIGAVNAPFSLAGLDLSLKSGLADQGYVDIDALLKRMTPFGTTQASGPSLTVSNPGSVLNGTQAVGAGLTSLGSILGNSGSNNSLRSIIASLMSGTTTTPPG